MFEKTITLRVDVDTVVGFKKGIPKLLDIFKKYSLQATFFIVMGPDTMGRHILRFKNKGYLKRILRINPLKLISNYGFKPFFYGTLIRKTPLVVEGAPEVIKRILGEGHGIGIHGYNHAWWAEKFEEFNTSDVREELLRARSKYEEIIGRQPLFSACPNWRCTEEILEEEDKFKFLYLSDIRGKFPFFPLTKKSILNTLQIPQTMSVFHEYLQAGVCSKKNLVNCLIRNELKEDRLNVFTLHDWSEGLLYPDRADNFIREVKKRGYRFKILSVCAEELLRERMKIPFSKIALKILPGSIGKISFQEVS